MRPLKYQISDYEDMLMPNSDTDVTYQNVHTHIVKGRKDYRCAYCCAPISSGDFSLSEKGFVDGKPYLIHYCLDCVEEELDVWNRKKTREEAFESWDKRYTTWTGR